MMIFGRGFNGGFGILGMILMALFGLLVLAGIVILILWIVRQASTLNHSNQT